MQKSLIVIVYIIHLYVRALSQCVAVCLILVIVTVRDAQRDEILPQAQVTLKWMMVAQSGEVLAFVKLPFQKPAGPFSIKSKNSCIGAYIG